MSPILNWREDEESLATCVRCLEEKPVLELDRLQWCGECLSVAKRRAARRGLVSGGLLLAVLTVYVFVWIQPDMSLIPTAWILMLLFAFYLGSRVAREAFFGYERILNRSAVEATPESRSAPG